MTATPALIRKRTRRGSHQIIADTLREQGEATANELAQLTRIDFLGVSSCLVGMRRRCEVKRTIPKPGTPAVWRLA